MGVKVKKRKTNCKLESDHFSGTRVERRALFSVPQLCVSALQSNAIYNVIYQVMLFEIFPLSGTGCLDDACQVSDVR